MTCIVGLISKQDNCIYIGGDSAGVAGYNIRTRKDPKVFQRGQFIFGFTTSFRMGQLLMCGDLELRKQRQEEDTYVYMVTTFIDSIRVLFKKGGFLSISDSEESGGTFLVGYKNRLFCVESDFQVGEVYDEYCAVGCGEDYALGSLYSTKGTVMSPEERITVALEASEYHNGGVRKPFNIVKLSF